MNSYFSRLLKATFLTGIAYLASYIVDGHIVMENVLFNMAFLALARTNPHHEGNPS